MPKVEKELQYTLLNGILVPVPQHIDASGNFVATGENNPLPTKEMTTDYQKPVEIQSAMQDVIQTHNAVTVPTNNNNTNPDWKDLNGITEVGVTVQSDSNTGQFSCVILWSNDMVNIHGATTALPTAVAIWANSRGTTVRTSARFAKVIIINADTAAAHTMSSWLYKKPI
jgi:hypothetical protein